MDRYKNRSESNSPEYNAFLDSYKTDHDVPYYLYSGPEGKTRSANWSDKQAMKELKRIAPTGAIYLRHEKTEMLCFVTDDPALPGFILDCKDEEGTRLQIQFYYFAKTRRLIGCTGSLTNMAIARGQEIHWGHRMPFTASSYNDDELLKKLETAFCESGLPYYIYLGPKDTRKEGAEWADGSRPVSDTGMIYIECVQAEFTARVCEDENHPGFELSCWDSFGTLERLRVMLCTGGLIRVECLENGSYIELGSYVMPFRRKPGRKPDAKFAK